MGLAYLFALVVGMGILTIQAFLGSKDADADHDHDFDKDFDFDGDVDADADFDVEADADADADVDGELDGDHDHASDVHVEGDGDAGLGGLVALFLSVRFWVFASLGFGLSGTLLHFLTGVDPTPTFVTAVVLGLVSGLTAALTFRALKRTASSGAVHAESAVGRVGRVIVPMEKDRIGKIRIELGGSSVDFIAKTDGLRIERGDMVVVEEVEGENAQVSKAPEELQ